MTMFGSTVALGFGAHQLCSDGFDAITSGSPEPLSCNLLWQSMSISSRGAQSPWSLLVRTLPGIDDCPLSVNLGVTPELWVAFF
jgi:hypothetical protein